MPRIIVTGFVRSPPVRPHSHTRSPPSQPASSQASRWSPLDTGHSPTDGSRTAPRTHTHTHGRPRSCGGDAPARAPPRADRGRGWTRSTPASQPGEPEAAHAHTRARQYLCSIAGAAHTSAPSGARTQARTPRRPRGRHARTLDRHHPAHRHRRRRRRVPGHATRRRHARARRQTRGSTPHQQRERNA